MQAGGSLRSSLFGDPEMRDGEIASDEVAIVFGIENGALDVVAGESLDGLERLPERQRDDLGAVAFIALKDVGTAIARRLAITDQACRSDVLGIRRGVFAFRPSPPDPRYHGSSQF